MTNPAIITALANDYEYETVFVRYLHALAKPGDVLIGLTTSGSKNVHLARDYAKEIGMCYIRVQHGTNTQATQEVHLKWLHKVWKSLEARFTGE